MSEDDRKLEAFNVLQNSFYGKSRTLRLSNAQIKIVLDAMLKFKPVDNKCICQCGSEYYHTYKCVNTLCDNCVIYKKSW